MARVSIGPCNWYVGDWVIVIMPSTYLLLILFLFVVVVVVVVDYFYFIYFMNLFKTEIDNKYRQLRSSI